VPISVLCYVVVVVVVALVLVSHSVVQYGLVAGSGDHSSMGKCVCMRFCGFLHHSTPPFLHWHFLVSCTGGYQLRRYPTVPNSEQARKSTKT
jgi:hypothetical protein